MNSQSTSTIIMVPPDHFRYNEQTAKSNPFQKKLAEQTSAQKIQKAALTEFASMVKKLHKQGITVYILQNRSDIATPDAVFPNNWFSHHADGTLVIYPIQNRNRRYERQTEALVTILQTAGVTINKSINLTADEEEGLFLESTGSMIFDRVHRIAFAMASPRTIKEEFEKWCRLMKYKGIFINSTAEHVKTVYHTNINMSIGSDFAVVCFDVISDIKEKEIVRNELKELGKEIITITLDQVYQFCGNILELQTEDGEKIIAMSETAKKAFTKNQISTLEKYGSILSFAIPTIESIGGGGVRCMIAEIFTENN